jgi:arylsulfatase A-like enzyme
MRRPSPSHPTRRRAGPLALSLALAAGLGGCSDPAPDRPSVVLVTLDTTRADHLGCYGYGKNTSPRLDGLAREGARFDLCISSAAVTPVSHASIFSGREPQNHGVRVLFAAAGYRLPDDVPTLASVLRAEGYATGAFLSAYPVSEEFGFDRGFDVFDNGIGEPAEGKMQDQDGFAGWDTNRFQRRSDDTTDAALAWLETVDEPFFLWIHYWDPHDPNLLPPVEHVRRFVPGFERATTWNVPLYDAEIAYMDGQFGRVLDHLDATGRAADTLVAVTSDHGEGWYEHDWHAHRILYQEQIHLPLILRGPGVATTTVPDLVRSIDVFPTLLELAGLPVPDGVDGRSLVPLLAGEPDEPRLAYADQLNLWDTNARMLEKRPQDDLLHVMMDARWKLIFRPLRPDESELYDLDADPDEAVNLYRPDHPEGLRLRAELERRDPFVLESFGEAAGDGERSEALRELGYIDDGDDG